MTPDGNHVYVANSNSNNVSVIATATNTVVATVSVRRSPDMVAVTPDGKHAYVTNFIPGIPGIVSVIATATNTVVATVPVGVFPIGVAVTSDGKHVYVMNDADNNVSVIDTASNTVVATVPVGSCPFAVAFTPDGKYAYVANYGPFDPIQMNGTVSVIDTASNTVVATVGVGLGSSAIAIVPPPPGVPFVAFSALLAIQFGGTPNQDAFGFGSNITLSSTAPAINPVTRAGHAPGLQLRHHHPDRLLRRAKGRVIRLQGGHRRREPRSADKADGHAAIRIPSEGDWRQLDRNHENGVCDPGHWGRQLQQQQQRRNLGHGRDFSLNAGFQACSGRMTGSRAKASRCRGRFRRAVTPRNDRQ